MPPAIRPSRLKIGDFSLYYERVGSGPALIFLHGLGGNHLSWWQQVPYFMRWYECITLDQRGFGLSPDTDGTFNESHPNDLGALLDYLRIEKAVLIGQSMGGWTIVGYALSHPERVAAMVMADTPGGIMVPEMAQMLSARPPLAVAEEPPIGSMPTYAADYFARVPQMAYLYDDLRILGARPPQDAIRRIGARRYDLVQVRSRLTMPILCMVGDEDVLFPKAAMKAVAETLPKGRLVKVPHCGHSIYFERPEQFNQLVHDFLGEVGWGAEPAIS